MATTLDTMIIETASYVKAEITKSGATYDADSTIIVNKIISGLNSAKDIIARQRYNLYFSETIALDVNSDFLPTALSKIFYVVTRITVNGAEIYFEKKLNSIHCAAPASSSVVVEYIYIPPDFAGLTDAYPFPVKINFRALCYYSASKYFEMRGGRSDQRKSQMWYTNWRKELEGIGIENLAEIIDAYPTSYEG